MEFNFDNIKDLMRGDHHQPLPPELDWSNMQDGILDKMQAIEQAALPPTNGKSPQKRMWLFLCLFLTLSLALTAGWVFFLQEKTPDQEPATVAVVPLSEAATDPGRSATMDQALPMPQTGDAETQGGGTAGTPSAQVLRPAGGATASIQGQSRLRSAQMTATPAPGRFDTFVDGGGVGGSHHASESTIGSIRPLAVFPAAGLPLAIPEGKAAMPVSLDLPRLREANQVASGPQPQDSASLPPIPQIRPVNQVILEGGINFWAEGYGRTKPERARYEAPIPSFQLQGAYMKGLQGGYFLMAGFQYQRLESKLEYRSTIEDYPITLKDTILEVRQNLLTGEETIVRGDVVQSVQAERRVRHYNMTQLFKASLAMGKSWRFRSFQTDAYVGSALNGLVRNEGRMFFEGEIIDYSGISNPFFRNRWTLDGVAGARVHYFPWQQIGITAGFQAQRSLTNWSNQADGRFYPASFSLQLGLSYAL